MGLTANSLPEASLEDVGAGKFQLLFSSAENVLEQEFLAFLKQETIFHRSLAAVVVRLRLITPTSTLIILDIIKTSPNNRL